MLDKQDIWSLKAVLQCSTICEELCCSLLGLYSLGYIRYIYKLNMVRRNLVSSQFLQITFFSSFFTK